MKINIYANYGCLGREKQTVYSYGVPATSTYDKITVSLPDGWTFEDPFLTDETGRRYMIYEVLTSENDDPVIDTGKQRYVLK